MFYDKDFKKSSFTPNHPYDPHCVSVRRAEGEVSVKDTKLGNESPILHFTHAEWKAFIAGVKKGEFDLEQGLQAQGRDSIPTFIFSYGLEVFLLPQCITSLLLTRVVYWHLYTPDL